MGKYLCFYSFVHITVNGGAVLLYNTINGARILADNFLLVEKLGSLIACADACFYGIKVDSVLELEEAYQVFQNQVVEFSFGDVLSLDDKCLPIHIAPSLKVLNNTVAFGRDEKREKNMTAGSEFQDKDLRLNENVFQLSFFINSARQERWKYCQRVYKQYLFPEIGRREELDFKLVEELLGADFPNLSAVNLVVGAVTEDNGFAINHLLRRVKDKKVTLMVYVLIDDFIKIAQSVDRVTDVIYVVWVDSYEKQFEIWNKSEFKQLSFHFLVSNDVELEALGAYPDSPNNFICFYYTGDNKQFCIDNLSYTMDDLFNDTREEKELLVNMAFDSNHMGHLVVLSNGKVYSNINKESIGHFPSDSIEKVLQREFMQSKHWFITRKEMKPCDTCLFCALCPAITDIEYCLEKYDLCDMRHP